MRKVFIIFLIVVAIISFIYGMSLAEETGNDAILNQIEFKYNDALLEISRLKKEKESYMKNIDDIDKERINAEKEFFEFKNKILSEFKLVETKLTFANKEKDIYKQTLLDFKAYFMKHVSEEGEIINK